MKKLQKPLSLALAFLMALSLLPSPARAEGEESAYSDASVEDILVKASNADGHIRFGVTGDVASLQYRGESNEFKSADAVLSIEDALEDVCLRYFTDPKHSAAGRKDYAFDYISYVSLSATQGTIYNGYNTEGDTGSGVAGVLKYYFKNADGSSNARISDIRFVPKTTFSGRALITYYGYYHYMEQDGATQNFVRKSASYSGRIYIDVGKQEPGIAYSTDGEPARFAADDFSAYASAVTGRAFKYVSFRLPSAKEGALYYNYIDKSIYDYAVAPAQRFYRTETPTIDKVYFVPAEGFDGNVYIEFSGKDSADRDITGQLVVKVTSYGPEHKQPRAEGPFVYTVAAGRPVSLNRQDFVSVAREQLAGDFKCVSFASLPPAKSGTLYNDGQTGADHAVRVGKDYLYPEDIRFSAAPGYSGVESVPIVLTAANGKHFDSMLRFVVTGGDAQPLRYTVEPERRVNLVSSDFSDACYAMTGYDVRAVHFDTLPPSAAGSLYCGSAAVTTKSSETYNKSQLGSISFLANASFTGEATFNFTAYSYGRDNNSDRTYHGIVTIVSTATDAQTQPIGSPETTGDTGSIGSAADGDPTVYYSSGVAVTLNIGAIVEKAASKLSGTPATITLSRPAETAGRLCLDFASPSRFSEFSSRESYPISDVLHRVSFLPKAGFSGTERITYTVRDAKGDSCAGNISFVVTPPTRSNYFSDMGRYTWAVPAVDFFRYYGTAYGDSQTGFGPASPMKRGDFILLLSRAFSFPSVWEGSGFDDVAPDKYYADAIASAKALGIIKGNNTGKFRPTEGITREEAAVYLYRALASAQELPTGGEAYLARFPDGENVSNYAKEAMGTLVRLGIFQGDSGRLRPGRVLSRAETITILYRALT